MREGGGIASTRPLQLRPERAGGACLADPPRALEISSLAVSPKPWGSGAVERLGQNKPLAWESAPPPCPTWKASFSGAGAGLTPRLAPCAAVPGNRHKGPCGTGRRSRGQRGGSHDRTWQGLGRTSRARLTMVPRSSAQTLLPHSSRPGPEERGAGTDATRSTVVGGASAGAEQRHSASRGRREGVPF